MSLKPILQKKDVKSEFAGHPLDNLHVDGGIVRFIVNGEQAMRPSCSAMIALAVMTRILPRRDRRSLLII